MFAAFHFVYYADRKKLAGGFWGVCIYRTPHPPTIASFLFCCRSTLHEPEWPTIFPIPRTNCLLIYASFLWRIGQGPTSCRRRWEPPGCKISTARVSRPLLGANASLPSTERTAQIPVAVAAAVKAIPRIVVRRARSRRTSEKKGRKVLKGCLYPADKRRPGEGGAILLSSALRRTPGARESCGGRGTSL